ncbi:MAG: AsmA family protein [Nitrospirota bacterium]|nr:AsmA family protein [Nitrospirota bacterium]
MRSRPINRWLIGILVLVLLAGLGYALFPFLIDEERYHAPLEAGATFALGRQVTIEGPISLSLSFHPTLALEDVHIANPSWASRPDLLHATRLEAQLSLLALLKREIVIDKVFVDGLDLLLEEGPHETNNWTFGSPSEPSASSKTESPISATISEIGFTGIQRVTIAYQPHMASGPESQLTIIEGSVQPVDDRTRQFSVRGTFRNTPFTIELIGGRVIDLFDLTQPWPMDGLVSAASTSLNVKGQLIGPPAALSLELTGTLRGERLGDLNSLLDMNLPNYGPYELMTSLSFFEDTLNLHHIRAKMGESEFGGDLNLLNQAGRAQLSGQLTAHSLQIHDLTSLANHNGSKHATSPEPPESDFSASTPLDVDLDVTVEKLLLGETDLGSLSLTAGMREGQVLLDPIQIKSFGGTGNARVTVDLKTSRAQSTIQAKVRSLNYGNAFRAFRGAMTIEGSTDFDLTASGSSTMLPDFLKSLTVNFQTRYTTFGFSDPIPEARTPVVLRQGSLRVTKGGPVKIVAQGAYRERAFGLRLTTGSLLNLATPGATWPLSLSAQAAGALLEVKGALNTGSPDLTGTMAVSLKGRRLRDLDPDLPPVGPYTLSAQVIKEGDRYAVSDLRSRFGSSDLSGILEVNLQKARPYLTGIFTSKQIDMTELSRPGDVAIPSEAIRAIDTDFTMAIGQLRTGEMTVAGLVFTAGLRSGRLKMDSVQGALLDRNSTYAHVQGGLTLDAAGAIPVLSGNVSFVQIRYEHIFRGVRFVNLAENVLNLDARFSSSGSTLFSLRDKATVSLEGKKMPMKFYPGTDDSQPVEVRTNLKVESVEGGPLRFHADGTFQDRPFRLHSLTGPLRGLLKDRGLWPVDVVLEAPHIRMELRGHLPLPLARASDEFTFRMLVNAENFRDLNFLRSSGFPDVGPVDIKVVLSRTPVGFHVTEMEGVLGESRWQGNMTVMTKRDRPSVRGKLTIEDVVLDNLKQTPDDPSAKKKSSMLGAIAGSVKDLGSEAMDTVTDTLGMGGRPEIIRARIIPDFTFPVKALRAIDLFLDVEIKQVRKGEVDLGHATFQITLEDGYLTLKPLAGNLLGGDFDGKFTFDGTQYVPTLEVDLNVQGLDYAQVARTFGGADLVKGKSNSIRLLLKGRGDTLQEVLERASGELSLVDGPLQLATKYIDLWAADLITTALSTAWEKEPVTNLNCMVGYFDIEEGVLKSEDILIDTSRLTIAGVGKLNLTDERLDLILTPRPKDPSLFTLAHTVRITGPVEDPDVSSDKFRIAESGGWGLLGLTNPLGWVIAIPQIAGTTVGTMKQNPCVEALKSREHTAQALDEIKGGLWGRIKGFFLRSDKTLNQSQNNQK